MASSLHRKIATIGVVPVVGLAGVLLVALIAIRFHVAGEFQREVRALVDGQLSRTALDIRLLCEASDAALQQQAERNLRVLHDVMARQGGLFPAGDTVRWRAVSQVDGTATDVELPRLYVGRSWLGQDGAFSQRTPALDEAKELVGGAVTVFQRMNEQGDMLRVATTVAKDGRRAIGTYIPAVRPGGARDPVVRAVLEGKTFRGRARVVDAWYVAAYEPIRDAGGAVVGMLFAGVRQDAVENVRDAVLGMHPGKNGDVVVLGGEGPDRGVYFVSPGGKNDGTNVWGARDEDGRLFVQELVAQAVALAPGQTASIAYRFRRPNGDRVDRVAAVSYYAPWDWVVVAGVDRAEAETAARNVRRTLLIAGLLLFLLAGAAFLFAVRTARRTAARISAPVEAMAAAAEALAAGDVQQTIEHRGDDEVGRLAEAFRHTLTYVREVAGGAAAMAQGDLAYPLQPRSERDLLTRSFQQAQAALRTVLEQIERVSRAAMEGRLTERAEVAGGGTYAEVLRGVNGTLDAVTAPLGVAARYVERISRGEIPPAIAEAWPGDLAPLRQNLNTCAGVLAALITAMEKLTAEGAGGELDLAVDASAFRGAFRTMADATQEMATDRRAVRRAMEAVGELSRGNFAAPLERLGGKRAFLSETVEQLRRNLTALIGEADGLAGRAVAGELTARADASRHPGDYRRVIDGLNRTLDAVIAPGREATAALERLAARDLRARVASRFQGDHARLTEALNATAMSLERAVAQVADASREVSSASAQIASSSQAVAAGASQQAATIEETTAALDHLSGSAQRAAIAARQADALASQARSAASDGAASVAQVEGAMERIRTAAEGTGQIIRHVSEIAFQTNLLALNAAVEAARAGEAGRGFAVVAEEVRSLALRAKDAAQKTEELIQRSVAEVGAGEQAARQAGGKLGEIVETVAKVDGVVSEITSRTREQEAGIRQVAASVDEMNKVVQQNAASAEESSAAASELSAQAQELAAMVGTFRLEAGSREADAPPPPVGKRLAG